MKNIVPAAGGKRHGNPGPGFKVAHNYQQHLKVYKPSKYGKAKQKGVKQCS